jgi:hypothetical protein
MLQALRKQGFAALIQHLFEQLRPMPEQPKNSEQPMD